MKKVSSLDLFHILEDGNSLDGDVEMSENDLGCDTDEEPIEESGDSGEYSESMSLDYLILYVIRQDC